MSENSCPDDKFHFVLEASQRSNMICLNLYTKEIEASPGESAALSLFSRHVNNRAFPSTTDETQVCCFKYFSVKILCGICYLMHVLMWFSISVSEYCKTTLHMERSDGQL